MLEEGFVSILLLVSLENLLVVLLPLNYVESLYNFHSDFSKKKILISLLIFESFIFVLLVILYFLLAGWVEVYFNISFDWIYISIIFISLSKAFYRLFSFLYQMEESHSYSIRVKSISYFVPLIFGLIGILLLDDTIVGFFIGRAIGYLALFLSDFMRFKIHFRLIKEFDMRIVKYFIRNSKFLTVNGLTGWLLGFGVINIVGLFQPLSTTAQIGYLLNIWMILLLVANGINGVFEPRMKKLFAEGCAKAINLSRKLLLFYLLVGVTGFLSLYFFDFIRILPEFAQKFEIVIPFAFLILMAQGFQYASVPFFYFTDNYKMLSFVVILSSIISIGFLTGGLYILNEIICILFVFVFCYFIKGLSIFTISLFVISKYRKGNA